MLSLPVWSPTRTVILVLTRVFCVCICVQVELAHRKLLLAQTPDNQQALAEAIFQYWKLAGHLASCAADVRPYTRHLPKEQSTWLWNALGGPELTSIPEGGFKTADHLRRCVSALQIGSDVNMPELATTQDAMQYAQKLMLQYVAALPHQQVRTPLTRWRCGFLPLDAHVCLELRACHMSPELAAYLITRAYALLYMTICY